MISPVRHPGGRSQTGSTRQGRRRAGRHPAGGRRNDPIPAGPRPPAAICISALNEEKTIGRVITEASHCPGVDAILVVVNGSRDRTAREARAAAQSCPPTPEVMVREIDEPLGHDVGRAVAAAWALSLGMRALLFIDADFVVRAVDLAPFLRAVAGGVDVALNRLSNVLAGWAGQGPTVSAQRTLNAFLGRPDLGSDSLVAVPHALSRAAVEAVGVESLCVPPLAQCRAVLAGMRVEAVHTVPVIAANRPAPDRPRARETREMVELILGDHVEAVAELVRRRGVRGGLADHGRKRSHEGVGSRQE